MVSYNRVSLARKKELEQQDRISTALGKALEFIIRQKAKLLSGLVVVFLAIAIGTGVFYFRNRSETIAFNELNKSETNPNYWIYIVHEKQNEVQIKQIKAPSLKDEKQFRLEPKDYYVSFSVDK